AARFLAAVRLLIDRRPGPPPLGEVPTAQLARNCHAVATGLSTEALGCGKGDGEPFNRDSFRRELQRARTSRPRSLKLAAKRVRSQIMWRVACPLIVALALPVLAFAQRPQGPWKASGTHGAVAAGGEGAVDAGIATLKAGGNAADAAAATIF